MPTISLSLIVWCDSAGVSIWRYGAKNSATEKSAAPSHPNPAPNIFVLPKKEKEKKKSDPARIRTWNPLIRSQMPYPLGHRAGRRRLHAILLTTPSARPGDQRA